MNLNETIDDIVKIVLMKTIEEQVNRYLRIITEKTVSVINYIDEEDYL